MMPAMAGEATEVPPTPCITASSGIEYVQGVVCESHMIYADPSTPLAAKREMSGTSRLLSAGTPVPVCQAGFAYPPEQVDGSVPPGVVHALTPPPPPVTLIRLRSIPSFRSVWQVCSSSRPSAVPPMN